MVLISYRIFHFFKSRQRNVIYRTRSCHLKFRSLSTTNQQDNNVKEITALLKQNNWQYLIECSSIINKLNPDVVLSVIKQNQVNDPKHLNSFFNWVHSIIGIPQNICSFSILAIILCNSRLFASANSVLERMIDARKHHLEILDSVVKCYKAAGLFLGAKHYGFVVDLVCCNSLLKDLLKGNRLELFWEVYNGMLDAKVDPDVYTYTNLINAHCRVENVKEGKGLLFAMEKKGCSPSSVTCNVVIDGFCRAGDMDEAFELKKSMVDKGLAPDNYTYAMLIDGFCKQKRSGEAKLLLKEMYSMGLKPDHIPYTALINGFMKQGNITEAFQVKEEMLAHEIKLNLFTFNTLIHGLCKVGEMEKVKPLFSEMIAMGITPDSQTYNYEEQELGTNHVHFWCYNQWPLQCRDLKRANEVFQEMISQGLKPNVVIDSTLIKGHIKEGMFEEARKILDVVKEQGVAPDVFCYNTFIIGLCKAGKMEEARTYLVVMVKNGLKPNVYTYGPFIHGYCKAGDMQGAESCFAEMLSCGIAPNDVVYGALIDGYCKEGVMESQSLYYFSVYFVFCIPI
ncbi:hypothetical protein P3X46_023576 [Hevea brasiliensis]|uniref:Pentacotripeptide-repeat region of PRORP domain-containing protein n=1 Tax=Hevea brasiliensis TaxID=3981 RepID=A0ABQ9LBE2_HEVBR|nr:hypothetical protein P3X46_023576 [Hevea brasiliensis]